ncbi:MAG: glycoside hydrolase family 88 protein [Pirellulaceae bacterium]
MPRSRLSRSRVASFILFSCLAMLNLAEAEEFLGGYQTSALGVTRQGTPIECLIGKGDLDYGTPKTRILVVGGLDGRTASVEAVRRTMPWFHTGKAALEQRSRFTLSAIACGNPDGLKIPQASVGDNGSGGDPRHGYPPKSAAYNSPTDPEAAYLWRWIGMHAPDLVIVVEQGPALRWHAPKDADPRTKKLAAALKADEGGLADDELATQLVAAAACETGTIPALKLTVTGEEQEFLPALFAAIEASEFSGPSAARREMQQRLDRTPLQVARQLSQHYGHDLKQVVYIPALALVARIRLGELTADDAHRADVERIVAPYFSGEKPTSPGNGSALSGHLIFCELARVTEGERRARYLELAKSAAKLGLDDDGRPRTSMPFHSEMSDALFMGGPILSRTGRLGGEPVFYDACSRHLDFMRKLVLREDGLYRHSPLDEAAWGRGNGFPALGMAMVLSDLPEDHPHRQRWLAAFREHMQALARHQDLNGCWHQVIDRPESYRELTSTCMITYAMTRGVRRGWLDAKTYRPIIDRAWYAIRTRAPADGRLVDVCTGTGKQKDLRAYYDRTAILGPDARGGAMALMAAVELAAADAEK